MLSSNEEVAHSSEDHDAAKHDRSPVHRDWFNHAIWWEPMITINDLTIGNATPDTYVAKTSTGRIMPSAAKLIGNPRRPREKRALGNGRPLKRR